MNNTDRTSKVSFIERIASKIPDPVILFLSMYFILFLSTVSFGGTSFSLPGTDPQTGQSVEVLRTIRDMSRVENIQWIFNNMIVNNWLSFAQGLIGILLIAMMGIGVAEGSGLFAVLLKLAGSKVNERLLPYVIVFSGILSNVASDAGYVVLIPLAAALYCAMGKNPLIGVAASFSGVSAGFAANLIPATTSDLLIGIPTKEFAQASQVPWLSYRGTPLAEATMDYFYISSLVFVFTLLGGWITNRFIVPKMSKMKWVIPEDIGGKSFEIAKDEIKDLIFAALGLFTALAITSLLAYGPLKGSFAKNIIIFVSFSFFMTGLFYGVKRGVFRSVGDVVSAIVKQVKEMGYMLVLTFFCFNFLAMLKYSLVGEYITYAGVKAMFALNLNNSPVLVLIAFIIMVSIVNLFMASMSAKWLMLGPIFIPMLYRVNPSLTPEVVAAAYRTADTCTNIITPVMTYAGVILLFCRRYVPEWTIGNLTLMMAPYAGLFLFVSTTFFILWYNLRIPFGF